MEKGKILITTIGRPTSKRVVKTRVKTINNYNIKKVIGLLPEGDTKNEVYRSINQGWEDEKENIFRNADVSIETMKIDLNPFYEPSDIYGAKNEQILLLAKKIITLLDKDTDGIVFDIASGRRIMSPICIIVAYFLNDLSLHSKFDGTKFKYLKLIGNKIKIITRPTVTTRSILDEEKDDKGNIIPSKYYKKDKKTYAEFNEINLFKYPLLKEKDAKILILWDRYETHRSLAKQYSSEYGGKVNTIEVKCKKLQEKLEKYEFVNIKLKKKHPPLTASGEIFMKIYKLLIEK